jgi:TPR repeat protein
MRAPTQASRLPWLAPEQLDGSDPRAQSDVWALGLVAFHILAGRPYFKASRDKNPDLAALRAEIAAGPSEPASARARALGFGGALPKNFDNWFSRCTALDPTKRFPDARAALEGAADLLAEASAVDASEVEEEPEQAAPRKAKPPPLPPMVAALAQNPKPAVLAIVILVLAALGGGFGLGALRGGKKSPAEESRAKATMWAQGSLEASTKACDGGDPTACNGLGQMYLYGQKTPRDEVKAAQQFQRGCDKADHPSCANLAAALLAGDSVPKDPTRAVDLYRKACDGGDNISCADLSDIYRNGNGVPKDEAQATLLRDKACKAGMTEVCKP